MVKVKKFVIARHFHGLPTETDLQLVEEDIPEVQDGEFLCEAVYLSVDPYMRLFSRSNPEGGTMMGSQVAKVIDSRNEEYPVGTHVVGNFGWRTHTLCGNSTVEHGSQFMKLPDTGELPISYSLGLLGMPGVTAYFGFLEICRPKPGEVVVVSAAAGAVGTLVGQIAKIKGCKVIGFTGTDEKVEWLKEELKFDYAYNYKSVSVDAALEESASDGVDCYFDNVGGIFSSSVLKHMKPFGRISVCGSTSTYNDTPEKPTLAPCVQTPVIIKQLRMEGFNVFRWIDRWAEGVQQLRTWNEEGKLKYHEHQYEGFESMPKAFMGLFTGENKGKSIVKISA